MNVFKKLILGLVVLQMVFAPAIASADMEDSIKLQKNMKTIQQSGATFKKVSAAVSDIRKDTVKDDKTDVTAVSTQETLKPPVRPGDKETDPKVWEKYYKDYLDYIKKLDASKQQAAWEKLGQDLLELSKEHPERISASTLNTVMSTLTAELKKCYESDSKIDFSKVANSIVSAALNVVQSGSFWKMDEATQIAVKDHFTQLAIELSWRSANNDKYKNTYNKIGEFYGTLMDKGSINVKAGAFNSLMHLFRIDSWHSNQGNGAVAGQILNKAIETAGGLKALINSFMSGIDNKSLSDTVRGNIAVALANVMYHRGSLEKESGYDITDASFDNMVNKMVAFINGINDGSIKADNARGALLHLIGGTLNQMIAGGKTDTAVNKKLMDSFCTMAQNCLNDSSLGMQTAAINVLTSLLNNSANKKDSALVERFTKILLNSKFDVEEYIKKAHLAMGSAKKADSAAYIGAAMANILKLNLEKGTKKVTGTDVALALDAIKSWTTKTNLNKMRNMYVQNLLFKAVTALAKQVYQKGSDIAKNAALGEALVKIYSQVPGLKDSLVGSNATASARELISQLKANGYTDLANRIEKIFTNRTTTSS